MIAAPGVGAPRDGEPAFRITRTGTAELGIDLPLSVTLSGTAQSGVDYEPIAGAIVIPRGQQSVSVPIMAHWTANEESAKTVKLQVEPGVDYDLGAKTSATVLLDNPGARARFRVNDIIRGSDGSIRLIVDAPPPSEIRIDESTDLRKLDTSSASTNSTGSVTVLDQPIGKTPARFLWISTSMAP